MDLKSFLFSLDGRVSRKDFWIFTGCVIALALILEAVLGIKLFEGGFHTKATLFYLLILWPTLAVQSKRWHDRNKSAWWILVNLIPIIGSLWALIENGFLAGTAGSNRFGENPLGHETMQGYGETAKPKVTSPLVEKDMAKEFKEMGIAVLATLLVIALVVLGTWFYLTHIKK